jgi:hypothetical protein
MRAAANQVDFICFVKVRKKDFTNSITSYPGFTAFQTTMARLGRPRDGGSEPVGT